MRLYSRGGYDWTKTTVAEALRALPCGSATVDGELVLPDRMGELLRSIGVVAKARGMTQIAREAGLSRETYTKPSAATFGGLSSIQ